MKYIRDYLGVWHPEPDIEKWLKWYDRQNKHIMKTMTKEFTIGTIYYGVDQSSDDDIILYETQIKGGQRDGERHTYSTESAARKGHLKLEKELGINW